LGIGGEREASTSARGSSRRLLRLTPRSRAVAHRHGLNANLVFKWIRSSREGWRDRRRCGYRRLFILLRQDGERSGINRIYPLYREEASRCASDGLGGAPWGRGR
jgi:hypothetical protein